jgi:hypothetical protein
MLTPPKTVTDTGLTFLRYLAGQVGTGAIADINPAFGSSTHAFFNGRTNQSTHIHAVDSFDNIAWMQKKFGFPVSRRMYDKFTGEIPALTVHEGQVPDAVRDRLTDQVGLFFGGAWKGQDAWNKHMAFFADRWTDDAIICGDDFAGGIPEMVHAAYGLAAQKNAALFSVGRVWALALSGEDRIARAIASVYPRLAGVESITRVGGDERRIAAGAWSWGVHRDRPLEAFGIDAKGLLSGQIVTFANGRMKQAVDLDGQMIEMVGVDQMYLGGDRAVQFQFSTVNDRGHTQNTKFLPMNQLLDVSSAQKITAVRLTEV